MMEDILCKNRGFDWLRVMRAGAQLRSGDIKEVPKTFSGLGAITEGGGGERQTSFAMMKRMDGSSSAFSVGGRGPGVCFVECFCFVGVLSKMVVGLGVSGLVWRGAR
jgi:hypothetical protein